MWSSELQSASLTIARIRCNDIVHRWLGCRAGDACKIAVESLARYSDEQLADQCISRWGLDQPQGDDNDVSWFEAHDADRLMLVEAFAVARRRLEQ